MRLQIMEAVLSYRNLVSWYFREGTTADGRPQYARIYKVPENINFIAQNMCQYTYSTRNYQRISPKFKSHLITLSEKRRHRLSVCTLLQKYMVSR
ncbi:hypothetical protein BDR03DRAFT_951089 [Suillus americanus]|nr:hypothetical protein BDR03DRAFT_951089 [Suillus americanus]